MITYLLGIYPIIKNKNAYWYKQVFSKAPFLRYSPSVS